MDPADALESLPEAYAAALRMRDAGSDADEIASRLPMEPEAVATALEIAEAKLGRLLAAEDRGAPGARTHRASTQ